MGHELQIMSSQESPSSVRLSLPQPRSPMAVTAEFPFIDALQKKNTKPVGWMPTGHPQPVWFYPFATYPKETGTL